MGSQPALRASSCDAPLGRSSAKGLNFLRPPQHESRTCSSSRRLLRRHLVHLAGLEVDADALDLVEIGAGHAHEPRFVRIVDRVNLAVLVDAGLTRIEAILFRRPELRMLRVGAVVLTLPLDHVGIFRGLAIDRPGGAVVVRRRHPSLVVDVGENLETERLVLVEHLQSLRDVIAAVLAHKVGARQQALEIAAHLFAAGRTWIAREAGAAVGDELVEVVGHGGPPDTAAQRALFAGDVLSFGVAAEAVPSRQATAAPPLGRARGGPSLFLPPNEGSDAPRRRMAWISPDRPVFHGRARNAGSLAHMTRAPASSRRATRHLSAFAFTASRTGPRSLVPRGGFPSAARGRGLRVPRSRVPHPAPPSRRLATTPLSERDIGTIVRSADKSTVIFHPWTI